MKRFILSTIVLILLFFTCYSCKVGKRYVPHEVKGMPAQFDSIFTGSGQIDDIGWSTLYNDTILANLIDKALRNNKDLLIASARIKEMEASKRITFANLFPSITYGGKGERKYENKGGDNPAYSSTLEANVNASWELDIWGNLRWANDAAVAAYLQKVEAQKWLHLTIVSQVASAYFELVSLDLELDIVKQNLDSRRQALQLAKIRFEGGLTSEIPYRQSVVELARTETLVPKLEQKLKLKSNDLSLLVGEFPSKMLERAKKLQLKEDIVFPDEIPSILLRRRPDIVASEQKLIEANANVGEALTNMFPRLTFSAKGGVSNTEWNNLFSSPGWLVNGLIAGPLFEMDKNKAKHKAAQANYEAVAFEYEKTVMQAFGEVNSAMINVNKYKEIRTSYENLYKSAKTNHEFAQLQYINGLVSYLDLLDAQRQLFDAEISYNQAVRDELLSFVTLYKVLGGGLNK